MVRCHLSLLALAAFLFLPAPAFAAEPPPVMLATVADEALDPAGWWMSEKYDGVRGYWNGTHMLTRNGGEIALPEDFRRALPPFALDGELWAGHGRFVDAVAAIRDSAPGPAWEDIRYLVFDAPEHDRGFESRMAAFERWLKDHPSRHITAVNQQRCNGRDHLMQFLADVERHGGEGVMLRAPGSPYESGRSAHLRKVKSFQDADAIVRGYSPGKGKYEGMVGALLVEGPDGTRFALGSGLSDEQRRRPPPVGALVTYKHHGFTDSGKPRFPVFWRVRELP